MANDSVWRCGLSVRVLLHPATRLTLVALAAAGVGVWLGGGGYPWWIWVPAAYLGAGAAAALGVMVAYGYQKLTYPQRAAVRKRRRAASRGDERQ